MKGAVFKLRTFIHPILPGYGNSDTDSGSLKARDAASARRRDMKEAKMVEARSANEERFAERRQKDNETMQMWVLLPLVSGVWLMMAGCRLWPSRDMDEDLGIVVHFRPECTHTSHCLSGDAKNGDVVKHLHKCRPERRSLSQVVAW